MIFCVLAGTQIVGSSEPDKENVSPPSNRLIACPDCTHPVSRRAVSCPTCGCPGSAIAEAVRVEEIANRPSPLVRIHSDIGTGLGIAISDGGSNFVILDAELAEGASTMELSLFSKQGVLPYQELQTAADLPLVRFTTKSTDLASLKHAPHPREPATRALLPTGETIPLGDLGDRTPVAMLDSQDRLVSLILIRSGRGTAAVLGEELKWLSVKPSEYRAQTSLLRSLSTRNPASPLSDDDRTRLKETEWLSPFLRQKADAILLPAPAR